MKTTRVQILVKYAEGCYMGFEHNSTESAIEHINTLKKYEEPYCSRKYQVVKITTTTEEEILFSE